MRRCRNKCQATFFKRRNKLTRLISLQAHLLTRSTPLASPSHAIYGRDLL
jgi:hypothetical protein